MSTSDAAAGDREPPAPPVDVPPVPGPPPGVPDDDPVDPDPQIKPAVMEPG